MNDTPLYTSPSTVKSLWQEYKIFSDRLEFSTHLGLITIPMEHVEGIEISESEVKGLMKGDLHLQGFRPAFKLDWANFVEHVVIDMNEGIIKRLLITPDDLVAFKKALDAALREFR